MTVTTEHLTLTEYCQYSDGTDTRYELVNGELIKMVLGTGKHGKIARNIERQFEAEINRLGREWIALQMLVGIQSPRSSRWDTVRIPDVVVLTQQQWDDLQNREAVILLNEPPPLLVVEVISLSTKNTDYRSKRSEYSLLGIEEYWLIDPIEAQITIFNLADRWYDETKFTGAESIISAIFPELTLTVEQILG